MVMTPRLHGLVIRSNRTDLLLIRLVMDVTRTGLLLCYLCRMIVNWCRPLVRTLLWLFLMYGVSFVRLYLRRLIISALRMMLHDLRVNLVTVVLDMLYT